MGVEKLRELYEETRMLMGMSQTEASAEVYRRKRARMPRAWGQIVLYICAALSSAALIGILLQLTLKNAGLF